MLIGCGVRTYSQNSLTGSVSSVTDMLCWLIAQILLKVLLGLYCSQQVSELRS